MNGHPPKMIILIVLLLIAAFTDPFAVAMRTPPDAPIVNLGGDVLTPEDCYWLARIDTSDTRTTPINARVLIARAMIYLKCPAPE